MRVSRHFFADFVLILFVHIFFYHFYIFGRQFFCLNFVVACWCRVDSAPVAFRGRLTPSIGPARIKSHFLVRILYAHCIAVQFCSYNSIPTTLFSNSFHTFFSFAFLSCFYLWISFSFVGVCLGYQCAVIEFARDLLGLKDANSTEFDPISKNPVVSVACCGGKYVFTLRNSFCCVHMNRGIETLPSSFFHCFVLRCNVVHCGKICHFFSGDRHARTSPRKHGWNYASGETNDNFRPGGVGDQ